MAIEFPYTATALRVVQPIGVFYVAVLPAELLLRVAASDVMSATLNPGGIGYSLAGTQRALQDKRIVQIADYIDRVDASFPNAIILAANHDRSTGFDENELEAIEDEEIAGHQGAAIAAPTAPVSAKSQSREWTIAEDKGAFTLTIPTAEKLAAIIDGQHRLFSFTRADTKRLEMELLCAIFLDLPKPFQAQLFATINSTQKPVDRSLTYELFGYNVGEEAEEFWTPDKLAVFLTRKLGTDPSSPLSGRVAVSPKKDEPLEALAADKGWKVSTAVVVDGILRLISSNPKRDTNAMLTPSSRKRSVLASGPSDKSPLRSAFLNVQDALLYKLVENYLFAAKATWWDKAKPGSFILKTVGIQAQFDILRALSGGAFAAEDIRKDYFENKLAAAKDIDFSDIRFKNASGSGRSIIRRAIAEAIGI